jgi:hypothetical protein
MRVRLRHRRPVQLEVFQVRPSIPLFAALPPDVKRRALLLLAQLLWEHYIGRPGTSGREIPDE